MKTRHTLIVGDDRQQIVVESNDGQRYVVTIDEQRFELDVAALGDGEYDLREDDQVHDLLVACGSASIEVHGRDGSASVRLIDERQAAREVISGRGAAAAGRQGVVAIEAPMPGRVVKCLVEVDESIEAGQGVIVVEAMKMENELRSPVAGKVKQIAVLEGAQVEAGVALVLIDASATEGTPEGFEAAS